MLWNTSGDANNSYVDDSPVDPKGLSGLPHPDNRQWHGKMENTVIPIHLHRCGRHSECTGCQIIQAGSRQLQLLPQLRYSGRFMGFQPEINRGIRSACKTHRLYQGKIQRNAYSVYRYLWNRSSSKGLRHMPYKCIS